MNVKSSNVGHRLNDTLKYPLTYSSDDEKYIFLQDFLDWLETWSEMGCTTGMFTKETYSALVVTTYAKSRYRVLL